MYICSVREIRSPPIQLILFGGCSPPKTHTSIAAFEASQFPQLRGLFISISLLKRLKNSFFLSRNPPRGIDFRFHHGDHKYEEHSHAASSRITSTHALDYAPNLRNRWHTRAHDGCRAFCGLTVVSQTALPNCSQRATPNNRLKAAALAGSLITDRNCRLDHRLFLGKKFSEFFNFPCHMGKRNQIFLFLRIIVQIVEFFTIRPFAISPVLIS